MSYIEREALREEIESLSVTLCGKELFGELAKHSVVQKINEAPTADVVEVVRCKDCIHNSNGSCTHSEIYDDVNYKPDYYCADGERREE